MTIGLTLDPTATALVIVDFQERLAAVMPEEPRARAEKNVGILIEAARRLRIPVLVTEQYPKGLGPTVASLREKLEGLETQPQWVEKVEFDACGNASFAEALGALGRSRIILTGLEAHICVYQTARGLAGRGFAAHVPLDATCSRVLENRRVAERLWEHAGAVVTCTEAVLFDLIGVGRGDDFKAISRLVK